MTDPRQLDAAQVVAHFGLQPLPLEGGMFRQTWADDSIATTHGRPRRGRRPEVTPARALVPSPS